MEMGTLENLFIPPPECPVFEPSREEFQDPLRYIGSIRPVAEKYGICKIKPPPGWQPPFQVDVQNFTFTPRIQRLNELEASTRIKLNFLDKIAKFWSLQGSVLKNPYVEKKLLDLYTLDKIVQREGGLEKCNQERKWAHVARAMDIPNSKHVGSLLKHHYERILQPFHNFRNRVSVGQVKMEEDDTDKKDKDYIIHSIAARQAFQPPSHCRRTKRSQDAPSEDLDKVDYSTNNELRKLQFYGAGPKMPGYCPKASDPQAANGVKMATKEMTHMCKGCLQEDLDSYLLTCLKCTDRFHLYCLRPPLTEVPRRVWRCPKCVAEEVSKQDAFGFEQSQKEYTLQEFGEMADKFKATYFQRSPELVSPSEVEREFWRIVGDTGNNVIVHYGADLHTIDRGSGFPTRTHKENLTDLETEYAESGWNLNVLPILDGSIFKYINADISGMKVPWMYVGMCFATFCWHNEDHWSYSINYLHWGEPKTWYGVPGSKAEKFEVAMRAAAPELFENQPDLLHQLVTIMNPNILMLAGVPVVRTNQHAGEFVITFPRSYHAGFNQGYNFAEAVNFAPADWLAIGRSCVHHYSLLHRFCVFSHDELICTMADDASNLDVGLAASAYYDMLKMVLLERELREALWNWGVENAERELFENFPDDERQCDHCKTTCFLSALTCHCNPKKLVCLAHKEKLCSCPTSQKVLKYRYTLDEMPTKLIALKNRAEFFDKWVIRTKNFLEATKNCKCSLLELQYLHQEALDNKFPDNDYLLEVKTNLMEAERCRTKLVEILEGKNRLCEDVPKTQLVHVRVLDTRMDKLHCVIEDSDALKEYRAQCEECYEKVVEALGAPDAHPDSFQGPVNLAQSLNLDFPELQQLQERLDQMEWLGSVSQLLSGQDQPAANSLTLKALQARLDRGKALNSKNLAMRRNLGKMQSILSQGQSLEDGARAILSSTTKRPISELEKFVRQTKPSVLKLPAFEASKDILEQARKLLKEMEQVKRGDKTEISRLEKLVAKAQPLPVTLEPLQSISDRLEAAWKWKDNALNLFVDSSSYSGPLLEMIIPREDLRRLVNPLEPKTQFDYNQDYTEMKKQYQSWSQKELEGVPLLRKSAPGQCTCLRGNGELTCHLCHKGFHAACVLPQQSKKQDSKSRSRRFLCPHCRRTKRPSLAKLKILLSDFFDLALHMQEGEAMLMLYERVISWQERSKNFMQHPDVIPKMAMLRKTGFNVTNATELCSLSNPLAHQLESLLLEADLLEVTAPEYSHLCSLDLCCRSTPCNNEDLAPPTLAPPSSPPVIQSDSLSTPLTIPPPILTPLPPCLVTPPAPSTPVLSSPSLNLTSSAPSTPMDDTVPSTPLVPSSPQGSVTSSAPSSAPSSPMGLPPGPKKRKLLAHRIKSHIKLACFKPALESAACEQPEQPPCRAEKCLHPTGAGEKEMVTCRGICKRSFHCGCVGHKDAKEVFTCESCSTPLHKSAFDLLNTLKATATCI